MPQPRPILGFPLSHREAQIAIAVMWGMRNAEVAQMYGIRHKTVKNYIGHICTRLGVHNRTALATKLYYESYKLGKRESRWH